MKRIIYSVISVVIGIAIALCAWGIGYKKTGKANPVDWVQYIRENKDNGKKVTSKGNPLAVNSITTSTLSAAEVAAQAFYGYIPEDMQYSNYNYNESLIHEFGDTDLRFYCGQLNADRVFKNILIGGSNNDMVCIFERRFEFVPVTVCVNYYDTENPLGNGELLFRIEYGKYSVMYEVLSVVIANNQMLDGIDEDFKSISDMTVSPARVREIIDGYVTLGKPVNYLDLYYTELDFTKIIENNFCHNELQITWDSLTMKSYTRENSYYSINKDNKLRHMTAQENGEYIIDFGVEVNFADLTNDEIEDLLNLQEGHNHEHPKPYSDVYKWAKLYDEFEDNSNLGDSTIDGAEEEPDIGVPEFPYPCPICGYLIEKSEDIVTHKCITGEGPEEPEQPDNPDVPDPDNPEPEEPDNPNPDNPDNSENPDNPDNPDNPNDNPNGEEEDGDNETDGFTFGKWSFSNVFRNLINPKFWEALIKGEIDGTNWIIVAACLAVIVVAVISVIAIIAKKNRGD